MDLKITNVRVVDPANKKDCVTNLYVKDGKIAAVEQANHPAAREIDGTGLIAVPGLVDIHAHLRDPGLTYKEDIATGTAAAAAGGITSLFAMPNTKPVTDSKEILDYIKEQTQKAGNAKVYPTPAMTAGMEGKELADYAMYHEWGIKAISDDGKAVANPHMMLQVLQEAKKYGFLPVCHSDDVQLVHGGLMNEGEVSRRLGVPGNPSVSEEVTVARDILLAEYAQYRVHIQHMSSGKSVQLVRDAKKRGAQVSCETGPHYLMLNDSWVEKVGAYARMNPPLRTEKDRQMLLQGIVDGTIDCIATDHAPHSEEEKTGPLEKTMNGIVGFETSFAVCYTTLVDGGYISLSRLIELMSTTPAKLANISAGTLSVGAPADIALFDVEHTFVVDREKFRSKGHNTPFHGMELKGKTKYTILDGTIVYEDK